MQSYAATWSYLQSGFKFYIDEANRLIVFGPDTETINVKVDIYSDLKEWFSLYTNSRYAFPIRSIGGDPTSQGQTAGDLYFLINGYRVVYDVTKVQVTGILFSDDFDTPWLQSVSLSPVYPATVSSLALSVTGSGGNATVDINAIADAVAARFAEPSITTLGITSNLNDVTAAEVRAAFNPADFQDKNTELEVHAWLDTYTNKDSFKADTVNVDLSALETKAQADARQAALVAEHDATQTFLLGMNDVTAAEVRAAFDPEEFKAATVTVDLSSLETKAEADIRQSALIAEHDATQSTLSGLVSSVSNIPTTDSIANLTPVLTAISDQTAALNINLNSIITDISAVNALSTNIDLKVASVWTQLGLNPGDPINYQVNATWDYVP